MGFDQNTTLGAPATTPPARIDEARPIEDMHANAISDRIGR